jgi:MoaA/NifB/PqqE/SkfB family radical SAM enzyme/ubiquinone/menaquinone biosynthesis C-methylase UbiE
MKVNKENEKVTQQQISNNALFLHEFMKNIDIRLFTPSFYKYIMDFLQIEKVRKYKNQFVINTFIPPFPGPAFDRFLSTYFSDAKRTPIQSVDLAVTNACVFNCWHCYNAGRVLNDIPTQSMQKIVQQLQELGAIVINFTGGEPCLRHDIADICSSLKENSCGVLATTGYGFTDDLAKRLRDTRVYSISISLDSANEQEHDRMRGAPGAFKIALKGIETAKKWGFYTYTCAVPSKKLLQENNFRKLVELNVNLGVNELQLIEPAPAGKIASAKLDFGEKEFETVFRYMAEYNQQEERIAISSFAHMESPDFFGCGAGHSHIYIDGSGEVSPCNMIPVTYGNAVTEDLLTIISRIQRDFKHPYRFCVAHALQNFFVEHSKNIKPVPADTIPKIPLPEEEGLPRFFEILENKDQEVAAEEEIIMGYDTASSTYEDYWLSVASGPIEQLFANLEIASGIHAIDCGCGTGYSTIKLAKKIGPEGKVTAIDLSPGMIETAKKRIRQLTISNVEFKVADVLEELGRTPSASHDIAILTWLIGYVGCDEIFPLLKRILKPGGSLGFVAHLDRSPLVPIEVFEEITRIEPESLIKAVKLKFPKDSDETEQHLKQAGFEIKWIKQGTFDFICHKGTEVYDHVMKSGAGTTFYYSLKPSERERLANEFIQRIDKRYQNTKEITIVHEYVVGIGLKPHAGG